VCDGVGVRERRERADRRAGVPLLRDGGEEAEEAKSREVVLKVHNRGWSIVYDGCWGSDDSG
jgi:hypothetical protein